jgi:hypothetical protein
MHTPVAPYQNSGSSPLVDRLPQYYPNDERAVMRMVVRLPNGGFSHKSSPLPHNVTEYQGD